MVGEDMYQYVAPRATLPWEGAGYSGGNVAMHESLRHRGWTLVDMEDGWRWAVSDRNCNRRKRICKVFGTGLRPDEQVDAFRAYVDSIEDGA